MGSNNIFKWYYDWELKMIGDKGMTTMMHLLGYIAFFAAGGGLLGLAVFLIVNA